MFTVDTFIAGITDATRHVAAFVEDNHLILMRSFYNHNGDEDDCYRIAEICLDELEGLVRSLNEDEYTCSNMMLIGQNCMEVAIQGLDHNRISPFVRYDRDSFVVNEHSYQISAGKASIRYVFALFCYFSQYPHKFDVTPFGRIGGGPCTTIEELFECYRFVTVQIESPKKQSETEFKRMLDSYLFNISYNFNISFAIADFSAERRIHRIRTQRDGQLFPYKTYKQELTKYYHQAVATNLPFMQYLAFYHVAEFFFQSISEDDAFQIISGLITRPSFSPYRKEDIRMFYNAIRKKMREQRDDGVWNEKNGLLLCLKRYVPDLDMLKRSIERIDSTAIDYYKTTCVVFCDESKTINFEADIENIYIAIRDRVYSTRNAIVHSKLGERMRYEPFKHDKHLAKEIPLIRAIAEEIIINSAERIPYQFPVSNT